MLVVDLSKIKKYLIGRIRQQAKCLWKLIRRVDVLISDPSKAREKLGWKPKVSFEELVKMMMRSDMGIVSDCGSEDVDRVPLESKEKVRLGTEGRI